MLISIMPLSYYLYIQNNWIDVENYDVNITNLPTELVGMKIVHISDLHLAKNASSIENILQLVKDNEPDIIVLTGDIIDGNAVVSECGLSEFLEGLTLIAPSFSVCGNHETRSGKVDIVNQMMIDKGVIVLDNEYLIINHNGSDIMLIGMHDEHIYNSENFPDIDDYNDLPVLMLAHRPELQWNYSSSDNTIIPDLIFSGHAHGGQFRIPFVGGFVTPDQGFFPEFDNGLYYLQNDSKMIVSRGLGNSIIPFRVNNRPHLPVITLNN